MANVSRARAWKKNREREKIKNEGTSGNFNQSAHFAHRSLVRRKRKEKEEERSRHSFEPEFVPLYYCSLFSVRPLMKAGASFA